MRNLYTLLVIACMLSLCTGAVVGATIVASDCSKSKVQGAINAAKGGDTVRVPAGTATWDSAVTVRGKSITLQGAGITQTVITGGVDVTLTSSNFFILSGFQFSTRDKAQWGIIYIEGQHGSPVPQFRITNCHVNVAPLSGSVTGTRGIGIVATYGVIDHCLITNHSQNGQGISLFQDNQGMLAKVTWFNPQPLGTKDAVVVEDCTFHFDALCDGAFDCYDGTKIVFRHNTVVNTSVGWHGADSAPRSMRSFEIYQNQFTTTGTIAPYTTIRARGGTGVIWGNTVSGNYKDFILLSEYRADPSYGTPPGANIDGKFDSTGYPLLDQVGRGSFPPNTPWPNKISYALSEYEVLEPVYQWGNTFKGDNLPVCTVGNPDQSSIYIKPDRDYYDNKPKPGYVPLIYPDPLVSDQSSKRGTR